MAINNALDVRESRYFSANGTPILRRIGQEDGNHPNLPDVNGVIVPVAIGDIIMEIDGVLRKATDREAAGYARNNTFDTTQANLKTRAADINVPVPTPIAIKEYLKTKFPADFT